MPRVSGGLLFASNPSGSSHRQQKETRITSHLAKLQLIVDNRNPSTNNYHLNVLFRWVDGNNPAQEHSDFMYHPPGDTSTVTSLWSDGGGGGGGDTKPRREGADATTAFFVSSTPAGRQGYAQGKKNRKRKGAGVNTKMDIG